jgi:hypothetical protein
MPILHFFNPLCPLALHAPLLLPVQFCPHSLQPNQHLTSGQPSYTHKSNERAKPFPLYNPPISFIFETNSFFILLQKWKKISTFGKIFSTINGRA